MKLAFFFCFCCLLSCTKSSTQFTTNSPLKPLKKFQFVDLPKFNEKDLSGSEFSSLKVMSLYPMALEVKVHKLIDPITPVENIFVRNNGIVPALAYQKSFPNWRLQVDGELDHSRSFSLEELKKNFKHYSFQFVLECGGNGRAGFYPRTRGIQWEYGAVANILWTGVLLKDVLESLGVKNSAVYLAYEAHDLHLSRDPKKQAISRGIPIDKAMDPMTILAFEMNGHPLTPEHGAPLRLVVPGYPASASGKWLKRLWVRERVHDGAKMNGDSYRVPQAPVKPGTDVPIDNSWKIIKEMPVKSLISSPRCSSKFKNSKIKVSGFAWTSAESVVAVDVSFDFGSTWVAADLYEGANRYAWQKWEVELDLPGKGYYEIWSRATDSQGKMQPMVVGNWNPKGYLNHAMPRIAVEIE